MTAPNDTPAPETRTVRRECPNCESVFAHAEGTPFLCAECYDRYDAWFEDERQEYRDRIAALEAENARLREVYGGFQNAVREALHGPSWGHGRTNEQHIADIKKLAAPPTEETK